MWRALDHPFPVTSVVRGRPWRLLGVVRSPEVSGSRRALGRPCAGRLEPAETEATAAVRVCVCARACGEMSGPAGALVISNTCLRKPNSRTVEGLAFLCSD